MSMRAAVMTESVRPTEEHGTGTTARRASRAPGTARRRRAPSFKVTVVAALAGFLVVFELLAYQLRSGHDPAVGAGQATAQVGNTSSAGQSRQASASSGSVVTRASGATGSVAQTTQPTGSTVGASHRSSHSITTRSSGGAQPGAPSSRGGDDAREHEARA
jgi:hypothetical protein